MIWLDFVKKFNRGCCGFICSGLIASVLCMKYGDIRFSQTGRVQRGNLLGHEPGMPFRKIRKLPLKLAHSTETLPVEILRPGRHHRLLALIEHLLEQQQTNHQPLRFGGATFRAEVFSKRRIECRPEDRFGQLLQELAWVQLLGQGGHEKGVWPETEDLHCSVWPDFGSSIQFSGRKV